MAAMALWACLKCIGRFVAMGAMVSLQPTSPLTPSACLPKEEGKGTAPRPDEKERGASLPIFDFEYGLNPVFLEKVGSPLSQQSLFGGGAHTSGLGRFKSVQ